MRGGRGAMVAGMALAGAGLLATASGRGVSGVGVRFGVDGNHARRRAGRRGSRLRLQFGDAPRRAEQCERDGLRPELVEPASGGLIADAALQGRHQFVERAGVGRRAAHVQRIRACALPAQELNGKNLRNFCRRVKCYGGGISICGDNTAVVRDCVVVNNVAMFEGGGILYWDYWGGECVIERCTIAANEVFGTDDFPRHSVAA